MVRENLWNFLHTSTCVPDPIYHVYAHIFIISSISQRAEFVLLKQLAHEAFMRNDI